MKGANNMKKSNLFVGIAYLLVGLVFLLLALLTDTKLEGLFYGFTGAGIGPGLMMLHRYFYWSSSKNKERYQDRLETEAIEQHDELKQKLREKSGLYAYTTGLLVISFSAVLFSVLDALELIENGQIFTLFLVGYLFFETVLNIVIMNRLLKRY